MNASHETRNLAVWTANRVVEPILVLDRNLRIKTANGAFCRAFRVALDDIKGHSLFSLAQGRWDIAILRELLEQVLGSNKCFEGLEIEQDFPGIGERVLLVSGRQVDGFPLIVLAVEDLTETRQRDLRLAAIVESSDDAIFSKTLDGTIVSWNAGAERIYGYGAHEMIGQPVSMLAPEGYQKEMTGIMERIRHGGRVDHFETKRRCKGGRIIDVSVTISPIIGRNGVVTGA